jgi:hypothetical protein
MTIAIVAPTSVGARGMHVDLVVVVIVMLLLLLLLLLNFKPGEDRGSQTCLCRCVHEKVVLTGENSSTLQSSA